MGCVGDIAVGDTGERGNIAVGDTGIDARVDADGELGKRGVEGASAEVDACGGAKNELGKRIAEDAVMGVDAGGYSANCSVREEDGAAGALNSIVAVEMCNREVHGAERELGFSHSFDQGKWIADGAGASALSCAGPMSWIFGGRMILWGLIRQMTPRKVL